MGVPNTSIRCEVRLYDHLFTVPEPTDRWEEELNPNSEILHTNALVDPSVLAFSLHSSKWESNPSFQFERFGYFVLDTDTTYDHNTLKGTLVFNRTVSLKEDDFKKQLTQTELDAIQHRQNQQRKAKELKEARLKINPNELFIVAPEYKGKYSKYNEKGIPTHLSDGVTPVTKSAMKKLEKELNKHIKMIANAAKQS